MYLLREIITKLTIAVANERKISRFVCEGCELRADCRLPSQKRRLCNETRAIRAPWW